MTVCKIQRLHKKYSVYSAAGLCPFSLILSANAPHQNSLQLTGMHVSQVTSICCYDSTAYLVHSCNQKLLKCDTRLWEIWDTYHLKRWDINHVMQNSVPCILNTRLCRPARRNIFPFCLQLLYKVRLLKLVSIAYKIQWALDLWTQFIPKGWS
jgi:hypothetical protein